MSTTPVYEIKVPIPVAELAPARVAAGLPSGSSPWWIARLLAAMDARSPRLTRLQAYHRGEQDTWPLHSEAARLAFGRTFATLKSNLAEPVVEAPAHRLRIEGFRVATEDGGPGPGNDAEAWRIWQANGMESRAMIAHTQALAMGECPVIVDRDPDDPTTPRITVEDPLQVIVERDPQRPERVLAALKRWTEPDLAEVVILYLPDRVEWWRGARTGRRATGYRSTGGTAFDLRGLHWELDAERSGEPPVPGRVPVVVLANKPRIDGTGQAEHESAIPLIDLLNKTLLDLATTSEFAAFPLRYLLGVTTDEEMAAVDADQAADEATEVPDAVPAAMKLAINRWLTIDDPDAKVGQLEAAALEPYTKVIATIVEHIGTVTSTPYHLLLNAPSSVPATGEALKTAERALDAKVEGKQADLGTAWGDVMRLAFLTAGDATRGARRPTTRWRAPAAASESQHVDALSKLASIGVDLETILELVPFSQEQIARIVARRAEQPTVAVTADQANAYGTLIRSGATAASAAAVTGMPAGLDHTGLLPVTVQKPEDAPPIEPANPNI